MTVSNISDSDSLMSADLTVSLVSGIDDDTRPLEHSLTRNYPNPFNASTRIEVELTEPGPVTLAIYDALGRQVRLLSAGISGPGMLRLDWDGRDESGRTVSSGAYWYRLAGGGPTTTGKMLMLK